MRQDRIDKESLYLCNEIEKALERIINYSDDDLPDLIPIEPKKLPDCVDKPCSTDSCAICLDKLSNVDLFVTRCGHQYHGTCMISHIKKNDNCPLCRGLRRLD